jgi:hypothetical protein
VNNPVNIAKPRYHAAAFGASPHKPPGTLLLEAQNLLVYDLPIPTEASEHVARKRVPGERIALRSFGGASDSARLIYGG